VSNLSTSYTSVIGQCGTSTGFSGLQNHHEVLSIKYDQSITRQYFQIFNQPHFVPVFHQCSQQSTVNQGFFAENFVFSNLSNQGSTVYLLIAVDVQR